MGAELKILDQIPQDIKTSEVLRLVHSKKVNSIYLKVLKDIADFSDDVIAGWLNMNVRTYRNYKKAPATIRADIQEHTLLLLSLMKHGIEVFGTKEAFSQWLSTQNFHLGQQSPVSFLNTISGIKFVDDRLTAMEYGDNV